jgi:hypothetical protein
LPHVHK